MLKTKITPNAHERENDASDFIPYGFHINDNTIKTISGDYIQVIKLSGVTHESADADDIVAWKNQLNILLKNIAAPNVALWSSIVHRVKDTYPDGDFEEGFAAELNAKYRDHLQKTKMMVNDLYLSIIYKSPEISKGIFKRINSREELIERQADSVEFITNISDILSSGLHSYGCRMLGVYKRSDSLCSELIEFFSYLANGEWQPRFVTKGLIAERLAFNRVFFGADSFEIRGLKDTKYGVALTVGEYPERTEAGLINSLLSAPFPFTLTQSFTFMSKPVAIDLLQRYQRKMRNAGDLAISQIDQIDDALDDLASSRISYGQHHLVLTVYSDSPKTLKNALADAGNELVDNGITVVREDLALSAAYWSQLPANFKYRPRPAPISSKNFAGFSSFHNFSSGRRGGNQWGPAVTMFKTNSGAPYYFNFHESGSSGKKNKSEQKALGNTLIIGRSGSGKTVIQGFLMAQSKKFNPYQIIFDKDRGLEIYVRAEKGEYFALKKGEATGFNPFLLESTESNMLFLESLLKKCSGSGLTLQDDAEITNAVRGVMRLPSEMRTFAHCLEFCDPTRENGIYQRLSKWVGDGALSWVFDNEKDNLDFKSNTMFGFDVTDFIDNNDVRTPVIMYLFHRIEQLINGRRIIICMDEFWKLLQDEYFEDFAQNKLKVIRKQNGLLVLGTQSARDVLSSPIAHSIVEQCATFMFLPNQKATEKDYIEGFALSRREFQLVKNDLLPNSRKFLIKQGTESATAELNLKGFEDELAIISGTTDNVLLLDRLIQEVGPNPGDWRPRFQKERVSA
jgi:type IV secretion system protein VirB4